jgi:hypothetical protein
MEYILNQTHLLKTLLGKFVNIMYLTDEELEGMYDFIFCTAAVDEALPEDQSGIYDTLDFLRDVVDEYNYTTIEQLFDFFKEQEIVSDKILEQQKKLAPAMDLDFDIMHDLYGYNADVKRIGYHTTETFKKHEVIVDSLYEYLRANIAVQCIESAYQKISKIGIKRPKDLLRACSVHVQILPNTDDVHFDNYYRAFTPHKKVHTGIISIIKKIKSLFSIFWKNPLKIPTDMIRDYRERSKVRSLYETVIRTVRKEQPIADGAVKRKLRKIMLMAKLNNPAFAAEHQFPTKQKEKMKRTDNKNDGIIYRKVYEFLEKKKWSVLKSPAGYCWSTTDNPGFSVDIDMLNSADHATMADPYWRRMNERSIVYFPLTHDYCLRMVPDSNLLQHNHHSSFIAFEQSTEQEFEVINKLAIVSQPDVLISSEGIKQRTAAPKKCFDMAS